MASRRFKQFQYSLETAVVKLYSKVTFAGSGAPTLATLSPATNQGILSISRISAGRYTITLTDPYVRVMSIHSVPVKGTGITTAASFQLVSENVASISAPVILIQYSDAAGVAVDPASGEAALIEITLKNSSIQ